MLQHLLRSRSHRLSSAHAKARLSHFVEVSDCEGAMDIMSFALYHEEDPSKKRKTLDDAEFDEDVSARERGVCLLKCPD